MPQISIPTTCFKVGLRCSPRIVQVRREEVGISAQQGSREKHMADGRTFFTLTDARRDSSTTTNDFILLPFNAVLEPSMFPVHTLVSTSLSISTHRKVDDDIHRRTDRENKSEWRDEEKEVGHLKSN